MACVDFSDATDKDAANGEFRIPLGNCADYQDVAETFTSIYTNLLSQPAGATSKGCAGVNSCHSPATNLGGWNLGSNQSQAYFNLTTLSGLSGNRLITPNSIADSNVIVRLSLINNAEPRNGSLWFNSDLIAIKRWVCQGAQNN
ncbi:MAG: hypothetical protein ACOY5B_10520 [Spirochaetota bacterium]